MTTSLNIIVPELCVRGLEVAGDGADHLSRSRSPRLLEQKGGLQQFHVARGQDAPGREVGVLGVLRRLLVMLDAVGHGAGRELRQCPQVYAVGVVLPVDLGGRHLPAEGWSKRLAQGCVMPGYTLGFG